MVRMVEPEVIDAVAATFAKGAALAVAQGTPRAVVTEALYRAALTMLIIDVGQEQAIATLRDSATRLEDGDDAPRELAN